MQTVLERYKFCLKHKEINKYKEMTQMNTMTWSIRVEDLKVILKNI